MRKIISFFIISALSTSAFAYTDIQYADAIFKAEGGRKAKYLYGIRSVKYKDEAGARRICLNTIRNNRRRFAEYGHKEYKTFIEFLGSRYCPTKGKLTKAEKKVNKFWLGNVQYYLGR